MKHDGKAAKNVQELYDSLGTVKEELMTCGYVDICEIRNEHDSRRFYLEKFNLPSIIASDAHSKNEIGSKFVWIKADPTFEGLKQILYEPEERVRISDNMPETKPGYYVIDGVTFNDPDFPQEEILFNDKLTCIIGGKSTGKSILLHNLALAIDQKQVEERRNCDRNIKIEDREGTIVAGI